MSTPPDTEVRYEFISESSPYYAETVRLRYEVFYASSALSLRAVQDDLEFRSRHLVALQGDEVVGYLRLTVEEETGRLTQFTVAPRMRGRGNVARRLYQRIAGEAQRLGATRLVGEIRLPLTKVARSMGFTVDEETVPSPKTGIPHRRIEMRFDGEDDLARRAS
jgi:hypothetical protein